MNRLYADIHLKRGDFALDVLIESDAERIGILGSSGSGKSMTLRSIAGIEEIDSGRVGINGRTLFDSSKRINLPPQKRNTGYMFQNYALFPTMSVIRNVMAGLKGSKAEKTVKASDMLSRLDIYDLRDRLPGELSGGQQQRAALARILVTEPELILLDEPFSALDGYLRDRLQMEMMEILEDYKGQLIMVSHSRDELYRFSDELFVIREGRVLTSGETKSVFRDPGSVDAARLTGCKNFSEVQVEDKHSMQALDWGVRLKLEREIPEGTRFIGYRAHYFEAVWGVREENCIPFELIRIDEMPFEKYYYLRPAGEPSRDDVICWFVQENQQKKIEERGMPDYLRLNEDNILMLK